MCYYYKSGRDIIENEEEKSQKTYQTTVDFISFLYFLICILCPYIFHNENITWILFKEHNLK